MNTNIGKPGITTQSGSLLKKCTVNSIGFLTPYKHLPNFTKFVESNFICKTENLCKKNLWISKTTDQRFGT